MKFIGIDISKATFTVVTPIEKGYKTATYANTPAGCKKFVAALDSAEHHSNILLLGERVNVFGGFLIVR